MGIHLLEMSRMDSALISGHRAQVSSHYIAECGGVVKAGMFESAGVFGIWPEFVHNATGWADDLKPRRRKNQTL